MECCPATWFPWSSAAERTTLWGCYPSLLIGLLAWTSRRRSARRKYWPRSLCSRITMARRALYWPSLARSSVGTWLAAASSAALGGSLFRGWVLLLSSASYPYTAWCSVEAPICKSLRNSASSSTARLLPYGTQSQEMPTKYDVRQRSFNGQHGYWCGI
jgi:hypothetical protein